MVRKGSTQEESQHGLSAVGYSAVPDVYPTSAFDFWFWDATIITALYLQIKREKNQQGRPGFFRSPLCESCICRTKCRSGRCCFVSPSYSQEVCLDPSSRAADFDLFPCAASLSLPLCSALLCSVARWAPWNRLDPRCACESSLSPLFFL